MSFIDLHVHSNASDGTLSPRQVAGLAKEAGLSAFALTDHDTVAGVAEAREEGARLGVEVIPGIEISSNYQGTEIHILGLFVNPKDPDLLELLAGMRRRRDLRNEEMLKRFAEDGICFTRQELCEDNPNTVITRAHVARALLEQGYGSSLHQIFDKYLAYGGRYCPRKEMLDPETTVRALLADGAFVSLAHPFQYKLGDRKTEQLISMMTVLGMKGLEVYHSSHNALEIQKLQAIAGRLGLLPTGGSDFHGANKPDISIGVGRGNLRISHLLLDAIKRSRDN